MAGISRVAREASLEGARLLVVVGGDGSVYEVANGLAGIADPPEIAVVPRGTGWDFVRTFGIPRDIDQAARVALEGETRTIDLGRVSYRAWDGSEATGVFANVASAGMSGAIAKRANETTKALGGKASYLWATFAVFSRWQAAEVELRSATSAARAACSTSSSRTGASSAAACRSAPRPSPTTASSTC